MRSGAAASRVARPPINLGRGAVDRGGVGRRAPNPTLPGTACRDTSPASPDGTFWVVPCPGFRPRPRSWRPGERPEDGGAFGVDRRGRPRPTGDNITPFMLSPVWDVA